jgi:hypothetical protein
MHTAVLIDSGLGAASLPPFILPIILSIIRSDLNFRTAAPKRGHFDLGQRGSSEQRESGNADNKRFHFGVSCCLIYDAGYHTNPRPLSTETYG